MKYNILINQKAIVDNRIDIGLVEASILSFIGDYAHSPNCEKLQTSEGNYFWISHQKIIDEMPLLGISTKAGIIKKIEKLEAAGIIERHPNCEKMRRTYYKFTELWDKLTFVDNPKQMDRDTPQRMDRVPPNERIGDYTINDNTITNISMSEVKRSDVPQMNIEYFDVANSFYELFLGNLKNRGVKTEQWEKKAKYKTWVDPVRLMLEKKEADVDDLRAIFVYLRNKNFWSDTISSTAGIRKHLTKLMKEVMKNGTTVDSMNNTTQQAFELFNEKYG